MTISQSVQFPQLPTLTATQRLASPHASQLTGLLAFGPPASEEVRNPQSPSLIAYSSGENNVTTVVTQEAILIAYASHQPAVNRQASWTFVMDGHRFYVLPLGPEGDWAYDTTTQEWCKLQSQGFDGLNFTHGVMWGLRVVGGDSLFTYLFELDPNQPFDEGWREIQRKVTGGVPTRSRAVIGVSNFTVTASVGDDASTDMPISLAFSDDNGVTWSEEFDLVLTDASTQTLIWTALGSFGAPGRVFRITDVAGPVRLDGADVVLTVGDGASNDQEGDGQRKQ
jgi:hypothetical protein